MQYRSEYIHSFDRNLTPIWRETRPLQTFPSAVRNLLTTLAELRRTPQ